MWLECFFRRVSIFCCFVFSCGYVFLAFFIILVGFWGVGFEVLFLVISGCDFVFVRLGVGCIGEFERSVFGFWFVY